MNTIYFIIIAISSYLLGSFNFSVIISKTMWEGDVRQHGSGNAGLTNSFRTMGAKKASLVLLGDILKGIIAVVIGAYLMGDLGKLLAGIFVVAGHVYPLYFGFKGGKGVLTGATMLALFDFRVFFVAIGIWLIVVLITRYVSLASMLAAFSFPVMTMFLYDLLLIRLLSAILALAVIFLHGSNIKRLISGTENKFVLKKK